MTAPISGRGTAVARAQVPGGGPTATGPGPGPAPGPGPGPGPESVPPPAPVEAATGRGRLGVGRLVVLQLALLAVALAAANGPIPLAIAVGATALLVVVPLFLRVRGQWWTEAVAARRRLRARQRAAHVPAPGYAVDGHDHDGMVIGIGADTGGWFATAAVAAVELAGARPVKVPLGRLAQLLREGAVPVSAVQLVTWAVPAPHHLLSRQVPCVESYRQLSAELLGGPPPPMSGLTWVTLRLDHADASAVTDGTDATARKVLAAGLRRLGKILGAAEISHRALPPDLLGSAVEVCFGLDRTVGQGLDGTHRLIAEEWSAWIAGGLAHVAFEVTRWPAGAGGAGPDVLRELCQVPAAQVVYSIELRRADDAAGAAGVAGVAVRGMVRVAAPPARLDDSLRVLADRAGKAGVRLRRLDGEQGPAGYASAPTGGSSWLGDSW